MPKFKNCKKHKMEEHINIQQKQVRRAFSEPDLTLKATTLPKSASMQLFSASEDKTEDLQLPGLEEENQITELEFRKLMHQCKTFEIEDEADVIGREIPSSAEQVRWGRAKSNLASVNYGYQATGAIDTVLIKKFEQETYDIQGYLESRTKEFSFTLLKRDETGIVVIFTSAMIDVAQVPTTFAVEVYNDSIITFEDPDNYDLNPHNPFHVANPQPGASIGCDNNGSLGCLIETDPSTVYVLTAGHIIKSDTGFYEEKNKTAKSPSLRDIPKARNLISFEVFRRRTLTSAFLKEAKSQTERARRSTDKAVKEEANRVSIEAREMRGKFQLWWKRKEALDLTSDYCKGVWSRISTQKRGGAYISEDWGVLKVDLLDRVGVNEINIFGIKCRWRLEDFADPVTDMTVVKVGRSTGLTFGRVGGTRLHVKLGLTRRTTTEWYSVPLNNEQLQRVGDSLIEEDGRKVITAVFSYLGDSGSMILEYPTLNPVGLLIGGNLNQTPLPLTYFTPIRYVLEAVKRDVPGCTEFMSRLSI